MEEYLESVIQEALAGLGAPAGTPIKFEVPQNAAHGDLSTNIAMTLAKPMRRAPRELAVALSNVLQQENPMIRAVEVAGPGFINISFSHQYLVEGLQKLIAQRADFGKTYEHKGETANVEWVSANPTGMLHAGHGRNICLGAALTNLLEWTGYTVVREYYFNNAGNQMKNLAKSVRLRYLEALGDTVEFPEDGYHGEEIKDIAKEIVEKYDDAKRDAEMEFFQKFGEEYNFENIKKTLDRLNIRHDVFFNENSLYDSGAVRDVIQIFRDKSLAYDKDGATWLKLSEMGETDDRVIVKSSGEPTYRLPDICYHRDKLSRGYSLVVDIFGADHIATVSDVLAAVRSLGLPTERVKVIIHQMVSFIANGELVKFSKRAGGTYYLDDLLDDVGTDATKFFFNMRAASTHLEFDLALAKEQSEKNPVYYVQYAHARIGSILRLAATEGLEVQAGAAPDSLITLEHPEERAMIKVLLRFPQVVKLSAQSFAPHHLCEYMRDVASQFHKFYHECRIIQSAEPLRSARLQLCMATKQVLASGCAILGVTAPESM
jgi:arginyl-tRNA synthetase